MVGFLWGKTVLSRFTLRESNVKPLNIRRDYYANWVAAIMRILNLVDDVVCY